MNVKCSPYYTFNVVPIEFKVSMYTVEHQMQLRAVNVQRQNGAACTASCQQHPAAP